MRIFTPLCLLAALVLLSPAAAQAQAARAHDARSIVTLGKPAEKARAARPHARGGETGLIADPSFENGRPPTQTDWVGTNPDYIGGSPILSPNENPAADFARTGAYFVVLGSGDPPLDTGVTQQVTATAGTYSLTFYLVTGINEGSQSEFFVTFGGTELIRIDAAGAAAYEGGYVAVTLPVTVAADGTYELAFRQTDSGTTEGAFINWFIDDVSMATGPVLSISPTSGDFGDVPVNESATGTVTLSNPGTEAVTITSIAVTGDAFSIDQTDTDLSLDPGEETTFDVTFAPTAAGAATGEITVTSNVPDSPATVPLTGNGIVPPPNDDFADAEVITAPGSITGTNVGATLEEGEVVPSCQPFEGASVWWSYTATAAGTIGVDLSPSDDDEFDTVLTLFDSDGTTELGCDDDGGDGLTSKLSNIPVAAGQTVYVRISGYSPDDGVFSTGDIAFDFTVGGALVTTDIPSGTTAGGPTFARPSSLGTGAAGSCTLSAGANAVSYAARTFSVASAGDYTITTAYSTDYDGYLLLYQGAFDPTTPCLNLLARNDDFGGATGSQIISPLDAGSYTLVVTGFDNADSGDFTGTVSGQTAVTFIPVADAPGVDDARTALTAAPNPVRGGARVRLAVDRAQDVTVAVFDVTGRQVAMLFRGPAAAGQMLDVAFDGSSLPAGVYVVRATGDTLRLTQRLTVVR